MKVDEQEQKDESTEMVAEEPKPEIAAPATNGDVPEASTTGEPLTAANLAEHDAKKGIDDGREGEEKEDDDESSQDSADRAFGWDQSYEPSVIGLDNSAETETRYEIRHWFTHVRKAETLWPSKEREASKEWAVLLEELGKFAANEKVFNAWTKDYLPWKTGWTPLHVASHFGLLSLAALLLDNDDVDVMAKSEEGFTPLHYAAHANSSEMLTLLLNHGADPNFETESFTPFQYWILYHPSAADIQQMFDHKASTTQKSSNGLNALHYFAWTGTKIEELDLLLNHVNPDGTKVNINSTDNTGETPLHKLMERRDIPCDLLKAFVERKADVNIEDKDSQRKSIPLAPVTLITKSIRTTLRSSLGRRARSDESDHRWSDRNQRPR